MATRNDFTNSNLVFMLQGARMVRELFEMARGKKACIVFFDEIDAIGGKCGISYNGVSATYWKLIYFLTSTLALKYMQSRL